MGWLCNGCSWSDGGGGRGDATRNSWGEVSESVMDLGVYEDLTRSAIRLVKNREFYARRSQPDLERIGCRVPLNFLVPALGPRATRTRIRPQKWDGEPSPLGSELEGYVGGQRVPARTGPLDLAPFPFRRAPVSHTRRSTDKVKQR